MALEKYFHGKDPLTFCKMYPLIPNVGDFGVHKGTEVALLYKEKKSGDRVVFGSIKKKNTPNLNKKFALPDTYVCNVYGKKQDQTCFPLYYLHWDENAMHKIKLQSSEYPANFFITAGINGCSLFIEGSPETPVVHHSNAKNINPDATDLEDLSEDKIEEKKFQVKGIHMLSNVKKTTLPKVNFNQHSRGKYILGSDYMDQVGEGKEKAQTLFNQYAKGAKGLHPSMFRRKKYQRNVTNGTVFGIRDTKTQTWKFYLQKRVTGIVEFKYPSLIKGFMKSITGKSYVNKNMKEESYTFQYPIEVVEIWPGGKLSRSYLHLNPHCIYT